MGEIVSPREEHTNLLPSSKGSVCKHIHTSCIIQIEQAVFLYLGIYMYTQNMYNNN